MTEDKVIFDSNVKRVESLCKIYEQIKKSDISDNAKDYKSTDLLRAAVVMLHSSFEEYYRCTITKWLWTRGSKDVLKSIPLPKDAGKNSAKYTLSELLEYKDVKISELFEDAIQEYMSRVSFNSYGEICAWGNKIGLDFDGFADATVIDKCVHRRHKIVHESDMSPKKQLSAISVLNVTQWKDSYVELVLIIDSQIEKWEGENS